MLYTRFRRFVSLLQRKPLAAAKISHGLKIKKRKNLQINFKNSNENVQIKISLIEVACMHEINLLQCVCNVTPKTLGAIAINILLSP